jgi:hypothetical protein
VEETGVSGENHHPVARPDPRLNIVKNLYYKNVNENNIDKF